MVSFVVADWISVFLPAGSVGESARELEGPSLVKAKEEEYEGNFRDADGVKRKERSDRDKKKDKPIPCQGRGSCEVPVQEESPSAKGKNEGFQTNQRIHFMEKENESVSFGKTFSQSTDMISQEQIPSGAKLYSSLEGGKNISRRTALTSHRRIHSGGKT